MQSNTIKLYYCHSCKKSVMLDYSNLICSDCGSDFLQEANMAEVAPVVNRDISFFDIISIFSEIRDPNVRRNRVVARIFEDRQGEGAENRPFRDVLRELLERSGRAVPASNETIQNINTIVVQEDQTCECKICADNFVAGDEKQVLNCEHEFHSSCLQPWLKLKNICPF